MVITHYFIYKTYKQIPLKVLSTGNYSQEFNGPQINSALKRIIRNTYFVITILFYA